ncbi:glycoside hydrolase family 10 protein [Rubrolithibacter danxiaensis]|uniref:glycoside hydrolase family 10 protein n=1 Tax=Rubrolithibacter danxiaensis TaxID=3390805 RepID=UPI003BF8FA15
MFIRSAFLFSVFAFLFFNINTGFSQTEVPVPKREFRGVWIATVANIDWPSRPGLSTEVQKNELIKILDTHQQEGLNAVMLQIRPATDAFYGKGSELWSSFLTGKQGKAPDPYYDPLEFAIEEAHKRGMELHAWFNPYRATFNTNVSSEHITNKRPEWFFTYNGRKLFNPGIPEVRDYIIQVIMNVVRNYDVDGIHFDDYFYPYPERNQVIRDSETFAAYGKDFADINDWRRHNVDTLIQTLSDSIHAAKKYVKFGISPFGIWRNKAQDPEGSESNGLDAYGKLYADSRKWVQEGWVDYINPQLYFPFFYPAAPFEKLLNWWSNNTYGKHLYIGQGAYRAMENREGWRDHRQIPNQIRYIRQNPRVQGSVYFSSASLRKNLAGLSDSLQYDFYRYKALPPAMLWLDDVPPQAPLTLKTSLTSDKHIVLNWEKPLKAADGETAYGYVIYRFNEGEDVDVQNPQNILQISFDGNTTCFTDTSVRADIRYTYAVTAIDRLKNESVPSNLSVIKIQP